MKLNEYEMKLNEYEMKLNEYEVIEVKLNEEN